MSLPPSLVVHAYRLTPGRDLLLALGAWARKLDLRAGFMITCVGSLSAATLRFANRDAPTTLTGGPWEIVSLVGTFSADGHHLHISLSDGEGRTIGGHVMRGCTVFTTAEVVVGDEHNLEFRRPVDPATTYDELLVRPRASWLMDYLAGLEPTHARVVVPAAQVQLEGITVGGGGDAGVGESDSATVSISPRPPPQIVTGGTPGGGFLGEGTLLHWFIYSALLPAIGLGERAPARDLVPLTEVPTTAPLTSPLLGGDAGPELPVVAQGPGEADLPCGVVAPEVLVAGGPIE